MTRPCQDCSTALPADCGSTRKFCDKCNRRRKAESKLRCKADHIEDNQKAALHRLYGVKVRGAWGSPEAIRRMCRRAEAQGQTCKVKGVDGERDPPRTISGVAKEMMA